MSMVFLKVGLDINDMANTMVKDLDGSTLLDFLQLIFENVKEVHDKRAKEIYKECLAILIEMMEGK